MKKPRRVFIAAVCMALIAALAAGCSFAGGKITEPESTVPTTTEPIPSTDVTEPGLSTPAATGPSSPYYPANGSPLQTLSAEEAQALTLAEALIDSYMWYKAVGVCCDFEQVSQDLSPFLTEDQKKEYFGSQYRLNCCHNAQEVRAHIDNSLSSAVLSRGYPDDLLFTDDQGNLYLIVLPTEYDGYRHITLDECSDDRIIASACIYDEDGCWCSETFTIERKEDHFAITQIVRNDTVPETPSSAPPMSSADYHYDTMALAKERFGLTYVEFLYAGNLIAQSTLKECSTAIPEQPSNGYYSDLLAQNTLYMYQQILFIDHDNTVMIHFPVFFPELSINWFEGYYVRTFTVPESNGFQRDAYQWFFEELGQSVDGADADAYAYMMTDSLFQEPELFVRHLSQCDDDIISNAAMLIAYSLDPDEYDTYVQLLEYLKLSLDRLTDRELHTLRLLSEAIPN